ncbi:MAG: hypothetical protein IKE25_07910 [Clostridia bacterium]|nr:hypothetical protein [Clostridia bacterium]
MKKEYVTPKAELLDLDYTETVVASGSGLTDQASTSWWKCETRYVDVMNADRTVCGYVSDD